MDLGTDPRQFVFQGLKVGDVIPLATPTGLQNYRIVAIGSDVLSIKINTAYISQTNMKLDFNKSEDILYQINLAPGADAATVATAEQWLNQIVADYPQFRLVSGRAYLAEFMEQYDSIFVGFYATAGWRSPVDRHPHTLAIGVIERNAKSACCARSARRALGVAHDRRRGVVAGAGHGVRHSGRVISSYVRPGNAAGYMKWPTRPLPACCGHCGA
jgi:hypothetical protein